MYVCMWVRYTTASHLKSVLGGLALLQCVLQLRHAALCVYVYILTHVLTHTLTDVFTHIVTHTPNSTHTYVYICVRIYIYSYIYTPLMNRAIALHQYALPEAVS
jgi:hypothetical protein